jgi:hypothetical protein
VVPRCGASQTCRPPRGAVPRIRTVRRRTGKNNDIPGANCGLPFLDFSENTNSMRELCPAEGCCSFIGPPMNAWFPHFVDEHIGDQSHCVFLPGGESMVDYIGASETIDEDWPEVHCSLTRTDLEQFLFLSSTIGTAGKHHVHSGATSCLLPCVSAPE